MFVCKLSIIKLNKCNTIFQGLDNGQEFEEEGDNEEGYELEEVYSQEDQVKYLNLLMTTIHTICF